MQIAKRVLVTGAGGLLAPYLVRALSRHFDVASVSRASGDIRADLSDAVQTREMLQRGRFDAVVHAAGFTDVDGCERDPARAFACNAATSANLACALPENAHFVVFSTDQVYGHAAAPHRAGGESPVNHYGRTKLAGEWAARANHPRACVLRTNFFGASLSPGRRSLSDFFEAGFADGREMLLFDDVLFSPLHAATLADLSVEMLRREIVGVYNLGSRKGMSKADFALSIARHRSADTRAARIGSSRRVAGRAERPLDLRLDVGRIEEALGREMPELAHEISLL